MGVAGVHRRCRALDSRRRVSTLLPVDQHALHSLPEVYIETQTACSADSARSGRLGADRMALSSSSFVCFRRRPARLPLFHPVSQKVSALRLNSQTPTSWASLGLWSSDTDRSSGSLLLTPFARVRSSLRSEFACSLTVMWLSVPGFVKGVVRRFAQSSNDHRGTPERPGRVVTVVKTEDWRTLTGESTTDDAVVWGVGWEIDDAKRVEVKDYLGEHALQSW